MNLVLGVSSAAASLHEAWRPRLGLESKPGYRKEHWTRVEALTRRLAAGWADYYGTLKPVADLRKELQRQIYVFIQNPMSWDGPEPSEEDQQFIFDEIAVRRKGSLIFCGGGGFKIGTRGRRDEWLYVHFGLMLEGEIPDVGTLRVSATRSEVNSIRAVSGRRMHYEPFPHL